MGEGLIFIFRVLLEALPRPSYASGHENCPCIYRDWWSLYPGSILPSAVTRRAFIWETGMEKMLLF